MSIGNGRTADTYPPEIIPPRVVPAIGLEESINNPRLEELLSFRKRVIKQRLETLGGEEKDIFKLEIPSIESLIQRYRLGYLSLGRAAELAGMHYDEFIDLLISKGISPSMGPESEEEFKEEEKLIEKILRMRRKQR